MTVCSLSAYWATGMNVSLSVCVCVIRTYLLRMMYVQKRFVGSDSLFIDECFATTRSAPGAGSPLHSGAHKRALRTQFRYHDGVFHCGEINILIALDDSGPGDGSTTLIL